MTSTQYALVPTIVLVASITFIGNLYGGHIIPLVVEKQNAKTNKKHEDNLSSMSYYFLMWNVFVPYFLTAFWARSTAKLGAGVFTFMIYKQLVLNIFEYFKLESNVKLKIGKVHRQYEMKIEEEEDKKENCDLNKIREYKLK